MCGRFAITLPPEAMRKLFGYLEQPNFPARYNIAPTQPIPVIRAEMVDGHSAPSRSPTIRRGPWSRHRHDGPTPDDHRESRMNGDGHIVGRRRDDAADWDIWLDPDETAAGRAATLLRPAGDQTLTFVPIGDAIGKVAHDRPEIQEATGPALVRLAKATPISAEPIQLGLL